MKTQTLKKKNSRLLAAHNRVVRHNGNRYLIRVQQLGPITLADAELMPTGGMPINLFSKTVLARELRDSVERGMFS